MAMHVELVVPEGQIWSGAAGLVIAKTLEGDIGVMTGHAPVLGILAEASMVRILPRYGSAGHAAEEEGADGADGPAVSDEEVVAAVSGGFFSVADNQVSILARQAQLGGAVDQASVRAALQQALQQAAASGGDDGEETADIRYLRALLTASGDTASTA
jgi:F-type H+-transporting ATPase subunit epsilon